MSLEHKLYELRMKINRLVIELGPVDEKKELLKLCNELEEFQYSLGEFEGQSRRESRYYESALDELKKYAPEDVYNNCHMDD